MIARKEVGLRVVTITKLNCCDVFYMYTCIDITPSPCVRILFFVPDIRVKEAAGCKIYLQKKCENVY